MPIEHIKINGSYSSNTTTYLFYLFKHSYIFLSINDHQRATNKKSQSKVIYSANIFILNDSVPSQVSLKCKLYSTVKISKIIYIYIYIFVLLLKFFNSQPTALINFYPYILVS